MRRRIRWPARTGQRLPLLVYGWSQAVLLCWWAVDFPGLLSRDSITYVRHVTLGPWVANHSVVYDSAILASLQLTGGIWLVTLAQTPLYAITLALIATRVRNLGVRGRWAGLPAVLIVLIPSFGSFVTMLWKDVPFAASNMLLAGTLLKVIAQRRAGQSTMSIRTAVVVAAEMTAITLFRNNGFIVVALAAVVLVIVLAGDRIKMVIAGAAAITVFAVCSGIIYPAAGIQKANSSLSYGVFEGDIAVVYAEAPAAFTAADLALLQTVAPLKHWRTSNNCLTSDPLFKDGFSHSAATAHRYQLAELWFTLLKRVPAKVISGHLCRASNAWRIRPTPQYAGLPPKTPENLYGKTTGWPPSLVHKLRPEPISQNPYHLATASRKLIDVQPLQTIFTRAPAWTYLAYLAVLIGAWRNRWKLLALSVMPIVVNQLTVLIANPAQLYRYVVVQLFLGMLFIPLVSATWPPGRGRSPGRQHRRDGPGTKTGQHSRIEVGSQTAPPARS
jgi:hypothetical protein